MFWSVFIGFFFATRWTPQQVRGDNFSKFLPELSPRTCCGVHRVTREIFSDLCNFFELVKTLLKPRQHWLKDTTLQFPHRVEIGIVTEFTYSP